MIVCRHHERNVLSKLHEPLGFKLIIFVVGVWTAIWIRIVAVHVNTVGILTSGTVHIVVATMVCAVGIGERANVEVYVFQYISTFR